MIMEIKKLEELVEIKLEQYECEDCGKKSYVNAEDKPRLFFCGFCGKPMKNIRIFDINIKGIGEY